MKTFAPALLAQSRSYARWGVCLALALTAATGSVAAQLVDTVTTVGVANTLMQQGTGTDMGALQRARALKAKLQAQQVAQQQLLQQAAPPPANMQGAADQPQPAPTETGAVTALVPVQPLTEAQQAQLEQGKQLLSQGSVKAAQNIFESLIAQNYQQPEPHFGLGLALFAQTNYPGAKFEFGQYATLAPQSFEGAYNLGVIAAKEGDHNEALKQFTEAAAKSAQASPVARRQVLDALASEQLRRNDYAPLVSTLSAAQAIDPTDPQLQLRLGQALMLTGKGTEALPLLYSAIQTPEYRADAASLIADIYLSQNLPDRALSSLNASIAQASSDSERADLLLRKAQLQSRLKQDKDALGTVREALQLDSRFVQAQAMLAQLLGDQGDQAGSLKAWQKTVQLDNKNAAYHLSLAAAQLGASQPDAARKSAQQAAKLTSDERLQARAELVQGIAEYRQKEYRQALKSLSSSSTKQPSADTSLWLGLTSYALKDYPAAIAALSDSIKLQDTPAARLNLGATYLASGMFREAEPLLQSVVKLESNNAQAWYQLGLARRALGNTAEAKASFKMASQLGYGPASAELK